MQSPPEGQADASEPQQTTAPSAPGARQDVSATTSITKHKAVETLQIYGHCSAHSSPY